jgi:alkyl sulfatase BDS1-like metallo-beta-lactamase superfamily hydrolase
VAASPGGGRAPLRRVHGRRGRRRREGPQAARELLADTYEQLGYGAENGTWRCVYLSGAHELRHGNFGTPTVAVSPDVLAQLTPEQLFDALAIRIDGPRCGELAVSLDVDLGDTDTRYRLTLRNGALTYTAAPQAAAADVVLHLTSTALAGLGAGGAGPEQLAAAGVRIDEDASAAGRLLAALDAPDPAFAIVTP